ncbi:uncharacterized protein DUF2017 [Curtobacterium sp. PhB130]|uniref:DUF2017 family protein n=1 Tax=unclassified Curtobacterium TaxID=257496 RepID=UPI000F4BD24D|nr:MULTISPECIES: DUF2017 family protein [unclassified Curtobacterium]ROP58887.1 uncharacterized protein DUF2017 [Curtobacterium sp. ZW137]ROS77405.1 uncharacterized protein DUF2017 [Curtobacterium sp. PhB130]TCK66388.1 uncharacterized protein DUF2017 [Curtobacterium sp. PhB136]
MIPFVRRADGIHLGLASGERSMLTNLTDQLRQILDGDLDSDPVTLRMFPDAYPGDRQASSEFRRYTRDDLRTAKSTNADTVHAWLTGERDGAFTAADEQSWLRCLTDLRLTIADRLGIVDAETEEATRLAADGVGLRDVYDWLGYLQEHLVTTMTGPA